MIESTIAVLDRLVCEFCKAAGEPVPVDAIAEIERMRTERDRYREALDAVVRAAPYNSEVQNIAVRALISGRRREPSDG